jgi:O-antigen/teichoic acid export membrane protein
MLRYGGFALSVTTARVVGTILTAATFPFLVRRLGVDIYGLWSYVVAVCGFTALVANPGLTSYAAQQVAARREAAFETISDVLVLRLQSWWWQVLKCGTMSASCLNFTAWPRC